MITAQFVKDLDNFKGSAKLYQISGPVGFDRDYDTGKFKQSTEFVAVSGAYAMFSGPETYIFPSDKDGGVLSWGELDGSFRGSIDHERAISGLLSSLNDGSYGEW